MRGSILKNSNISRKQKGTVLIFSIMMLIILTIISISSITTSILEEKSISNSFNNQIAFQSSETSLRSAEEHINQMTTKPIATDKCAPNCNVVWQKDKLGALYGGSYGSAWWRVANAITNDAWWKANAHTIPTLVDPQGIIIQDNVSYVADQPGFFVEELAFIPDDLSPTTRAKGVGLNFYRITSRGTGGEGVRGGIAPSQVYLQSIYGKRFN